MVAHINSFAFSGIEVLDVDVQVQLSSGMVAFSVVGLADKAVTEARERVRAAIGAIGLSMPPKRITVNLSPADLVKEGSHFDLPIAVGLLVSMGLIPEDAVNDYVILGELSLGGELTGCNGVLPAAIGAAARGKGIICPAVNGSEAAWAGDDIDIIAPSNLLELINHIKGTQVLSRPSLVSGDYEPDYPDMSDIKGQDTAKRAIEVAAAGGHNVLMVGPPGSGKSMLAARMAGIIPPLSASEMLEVSIVKSVVGDLANGFISKVRPFREPHHNCSMPAMVGGGKKASPGEITLAHRGILFLDELPEFPRQVLDSLRQPLEVKKVTVSRVNSHVTYPADFQFVAAMNPCRCGYLDDLSRACNKAPLCAADYQSKISGPLLDRIDIHIQVPAIRPSDIHKSKGSERSVDIAERVLMAREMQRARYDNEAISLNAQADGDIVFEMFKIDEAGRDLLNKGSDKIGLSMRGYNRVLRVARTIADLDSSENVLANHIAEAISYRQIDFRRIS